MARVSDNNLFILSETEQRAKVFKSLLRGEVHPVSDIIIIQKEDIQHSFKNTKESVCLVDLISYKDSSKRIITLLKNNCPNCKVIAIHIYRTPLLINPLFKSGIDGYIHSDPSRKELLEAINTVKNGNVYLPVFLKGGINA